MQEEKEKTIDNVNQDSALYSEEDSLKNVSEIDERFIENVYKAGSVDLYKIESLDAKDQSKVFSLVLTDVYRNYDDIRFSNIRECALKCLKLSCDPEENTLRLPHKLNVTKQDNKMTFKFESQTKKNMWILIPVILLFVLAAMGSTYMALRYMSVAHLNIDLNGDGIADLNLDLNKDDKEEVNISKDKKKPDMNIDYKGNRKPTFNVDKDKDEKSDFNLLNQDINGDGICDLNCDINNDGWPEINIDLDGDGKPDLHIDTNNDNVADLNFDTNRDGVCDLHCDTDYDNICDDKCVENVQSMDSNTGTSALLGNSGVDAETALMVIDFIDSNQIQIKELFPTDQEENNVLKKVEKKFSIHNKSALYARYKIELVVSKYTFVSDNFQFDYKSTEAGINRTGVVVPNETSFLKGSNNQDMIVVLPPRSKHNYTVTFKLNGIDANQNYDQGKSFAGMFQIHLVN